MHKDNWEVGEKFIKFNSWGIHVGVIKEVKKKTIICTYGVEKKDRIHIWSEEIKKIIDKIREKELEIRDLKNKIRDANPKQGVKDE